MATPITMPRQGNTVESCIIQEWFKKKGDAVKIGEPLFSYETDKASFEFESPVSGTLLEIFFDKDADVPVLTNVGAVGEPGENIVQLRPGVSGSTAPVPVAHQASAQAKESQMSFAAPTATAVLEAPMMSSSVGVSPRARNLAESNGVDVSVVAGSGPNGRVIERDVKSAIENGPKLTKAAQAAAGKDGLVAPSTGTGIGGRIRLEDLTLRQTVSTGSGSHVAATTLLTGADTTKEVPMSNLRKIIASRMMESLQQTAQLTIHTSTNASGLLAYRQLVKAQRESLGLADITITDLIVFAVSRILPRFPEMNALLTNDKIVQYTHAHVALAVDTPRGLMVPVVKFADLLSLNDVSKSCKAVAKQCQDGTINPDLLSGGTFTISNLGSFGIEMFTPVLNRPQVGILGVNTIQPKPVDDGKGGYTMVPHIGLSLTFDHRALDGAGAARFLKALANSIENISLTISL